jgi:hypothetical protein
LLAAFATLGGNAQLATHFSKGGGTFRDGFADLAIGYSFTQTNVHSGKG